MKKIIFFISDLGPGGAQKQAFLLCELLKEKYEITLITWNSDEEDLHSLSKNIRRVNLDQKFSYLKINVLKVILKIFYSYKVMFNVRPQVVISFLQELNFLNVITSKFLFKTKSIISIREYPEMNKKNFKNNLYDKVSKNSDVLVCQTNTIKEWLIKNNFHKNVVVIPNLLASKRYTSTKHEMLENIDTYILAVGTKFYQKGFDLLLEAYRICVDKKINKKLVIVGLGNKCDFDEASDKIVELGLQDNVILLGFEKNMMSLYEHASIFVLSSRFEGIPNVLLEAIQSQLPIVSFDCKTGPRELLGAGEYGILVEDGNYHALAENIISLSNNKELRQEFSGRLKNYPHYSQDKIEEMWVEIIEN